MNKIPIIDIKPLLIPNSNSKLLHKTSIAIKNACKNIGFFYIKNHHIKPSHINNLLFSTHKFFNLSIKEKMKIHIKNSNIYRGYTPLGEEFTNDKYDWHECVDFGPNLKKSQPKNLLLGPNQWPKNPNNFKYILKKHWKLMNSLGEKITEGLAMSLKLPKHYFKNFMNKSHSYMRISNYPPYKNNTKENIKYGIGAHIDYGFLTILLQDNISGLEIKNFNNKWIKAPVIPGTFLINIGHMIQRWTNNYYKATIHRVIPSQKKTRCSIPFFFEPNLDSIITPIEKFCTKKNPAYYKPLHFGKYLKKTFQTSYSSIIK